MELIKCSYYYIKLEKETILLNNNNAVFKDDVLYIFVRCSVVNGYRYISVVNEKSIYFRNDCEDRFVMREEFILDYFYNKKEMKF